VARRGEASGKRLARSATRECDVQQSRRKLKIEGIRRFLRYSCLSLTGWVRWRSARWSRDPEGVSISNKLLPAAGTSLGGGDPKRLG